MSEHEASAGARRVGMLTPSSNTVLEPYTSAMFAPFGEAASVHFSRFRVVEISLSSASHGQFADGPVVEAAERLAEARVHAIAWNGTSAAWLGLDSDRALCRRIEDATGVPATTTMLAFEAYLEAAGVRRLGLVTPYIGAIQDRIVANYASRGIEVVSERRLETSANFAFAGFSADRVGSLVREVADARPDAIAIVCTNFRGAPLAETLERETRIPVLDSVAITAAATMRKVGLDTRRVAGWGSVFAHFGALPMHSEAQSGQ